MAWWITYFLYVVGCEKYSYMQAKGETAYICSGIGTGCFVLWSQKNRQCREQFAWPPPAVGVVDRWNDLWQQWDPHCLLICSDWYEISVVGPSHGISKCLKDFRTTHVRKVVLSARKRGLGCRIFKEGLDPEKGLKNFVYKKVRTKMGRKQESNDFEAISVAKMLGCDSCRLSCCAAVEVAALHQLGERSHIDTLSVSFPPGKCWCLLRILC